MFPTGRKNIGRCNLAVAVLFEERRNISRKEIGAKYQIDVHFHDSGIPLGIPKDVALSLFRVTREALGNVVKHSGAKSAGVELGSNEAGLSLRIVDEVHQ